ncbi:MAG: hypothetical protein ACK49B_05310, partial [Burkholderiales bacterium]
LFCNFLKTLLGLKIENQKTCQKDKKDSNNQQKKIVHNGPHFVNLTPSYLSVTHGATRREPFSPS